MNGPDSILEHQYRTLLQLVQEHERQFCRQLHAEAEEDAARLLAQAYRQARQRLHEAVQEERLQARRQLETARAQRQTQARQAEHKAALLMLQDGWAQLGEVLKARWQDEASRQGWIEGLYRQARDSLPRGPWRIEHPPLWPEAERRILGERVQRHCGQAPHFEAQAALQAGLHFHADGAHLNGSRRGLLADRHEIEAQLLAAIQQLMGEGERP